MAGEFWLDDRQSAAIEPLLPKHRSGEHRKDDRRIIGGIIHILKVGADGKIVRRSTVHRRGSTTAFIAGRQVAFGAACSRR